MTMVGRDKVKTEKVMLSTLINQFNRGQINKNHPLQRKADQWTDEAKSGLAASVIKGEDIDSIKICEQIIDSNNFILWLIDGLQRLTVLESFRANLFAIGKSLEMPIMYYQGVDKDGKIGVIEYDLRGRKYKDLPDELKEKFDSYPVDIVKHLDCSNEEIAYHIGRYNRQTSMNANQKNILPCYKIASYIKNIANNNRFFKDNGNYTPTDRKKGVIDRIVTESIMTMFHSEKWTKGKTMSKFLNDNATQKEFEIFETELNRLSKIINQETTGKLFNAKNSFIWFTVFHKFTKMNLEDEKFCEFLNAFQDNLHNKTFSEYENASFDTYDSNRSTKDKKVVLAKIDMLIKLMEEYFNANNEEIYRINNEEIYSEIVETPLDFIRENVNESVIEDDIQEYEDFLDNTVRISSPIYQKCKMALLAMTAYVYTKDQDEEFAEWLEKYQNEVTEFSENQLDNFTYFKTNFTNYIQG